MIMSENITVKVTRPMLWAGTAMPAGSTLKLAPLDAAAAVGSGRAQLLHDADMALLVEATRADIKATLRQARARIDQAPDGWPWRPV